MSGWMNASTFRTGGLATLALPVKITDRVKSAENVNTPKVLMDLRERERD